MLEERFAKYLNPISLKLRKSSSRSLTLAGSKAKRRYTFLMFPAIRFVNEISLAGAPAGEHFAGGFGSPRAMMFETYLSHIVSRARLRFSKSRSRQYRAAASPALRCRARRLVSEVNNSIIKFSRFARDIGAHG